MKPGDLVIRAYAFHRRVLGTIIGIETSEVAPAFNHHDDEFGEPWLETVVSVLWADGTTSTELDCELDYNEEIFR